MNRLDRTSIRVRRMAGVILLAAGCALVTGCIPIGARVQNMYAQGASPAPSSR